MLSTHHIVFIEVAREKSFSRACDALFISQPAISKHVKLLEEYYKAKLFDRNGNKIELTPAGDLLLKRLLYVKNIQEATEFDIGSLTNLQQAGGLLKLGASTTVALYILPKILSGFQREFSQLQITLLNRNSEMVVDALLNQEINLGIIEGKGKLSNVVYQPFIHDQVIAVCSRNSPIARKKNYALREVINMPVALRERGSGTLAALKQVFEKNRIGMDELNVKVRLGGTEALKNFLIASDTLGFLPRRSVMKELKQGELTEIQFEGMNIERSFYFIQRKGETRALNTRFIKFARNTYK